LRSASSVGKVTLPDQKKKVKKTVFQTDKKEIRPCWAWRPGFDAKKKPEKGLPDGKKKTSTHGPNKGTLSGNGARSGLHQKGHAAQNAG